VFCFDCVTQSTSETPWWWILVKCHTWQSQVVRTVLQVVFILPMLLLMGSSDSHSLYRWHSLKLPHEGHLTERSFLLVWAPGLCLRYQLIFLLICKWPLKASKTIILVFFRAAPVSYVPASLNHFTTISSVSCHFSLHFHVIPLLKTNKWCQFLPIVQNSNPPQYPVAVTTTEVNPLSVKCNFSLQPGKLRGFICVTHLFYVLLCKLITVLAVNFSRQPVWSCCTEFSSEEG
jgi:hypothetical protein